MLPGSSGVFPSSVNMPEQPFGLRWRSHTIFILTTVCIGVFTDMFLYSLIIPVLPFMLHDRLGVPKSDIQQHVSGLLSVYAASTLIGSPVTGIIADRQQTRSGPYLTGLIALGTATILLFSSRLLWLVYIARVLQGISAAVVWTVGIALIVDTVGVKDLGKTLGTVSRRTDSSLRLIADKYYRCHPPRSRVCYLHP